MQRKIYKYLFREISSDTISYLRICLGLLLAYELWDYRFYFADGLLQSEYFFTYDGFSWVKPFTKPIMEYIVYGGILVGILVALGIFFRPLSIVLALITTYVFLLDKGHYNNHGYLYVILSWLLVFTHADSKYVPFKKRSDLIPYWQVFIFKLQITIVYFMGGIAKIDSDWLQGYPMRYWLYDKGQEMGGKFGAFLCSGSAALFYSYSGLFFDLLVPIFLWNDKKRKYILPFILFFHVSNHFFWNIGSFPWAMLAFTPIFFTPGFFDRFFDAKKIKDTEKIKDVAINSWKGNLVIGAIAIWFFIQITFPLRWLWLYNGRNPSWTGQGHLFAWRMMLTDTIEAVRLKIIIPETGEVLYVNLFDYFSYRQFYKSMRTPSSMLPFIHMISENLRQNGVKDPVIKMEFYKSVNLRAPMLLNDTSLNYANVNYNPAISQFWIQPWSTEDQPLEFTTEQYGKWKLFLSGYEGK